jgi:hypothetical protein
MKPIVDTGLILHEYEIMVNKSLINPEAAKKLEIAKTAR